MLMSDDLETNPDVSPIKKQDNTHTNTVASLEKNKNDVFFPIGEDIIEEDNQDISKISEEEDGDDDSLSKQSSPVFSPMTIIE